METVKIMTKEIQLLNQYKMALDESTIISKTNAFGIITYVNDAFCAISGYSFEELIGHSHNIIRHPDNPAELFVDLWSSIQQGHIWRHTLKNRAKNGEAYYVKTVIIPIRDEVGKIVEFIAARVDVTELLLQRKIIQRQLIDELTGMKNRTALLNDLEKSAEAVILVVFNIDRFSMINDYFGYTIGDTFLKAFAHYLQQLITTHELYRVSGDEFVFICQHHPLTQKFRQRITTHITALENKKFHIDSYELSITVSGDVAYAHKSEVYNQAHVALKEAKEHPEKVIIYNDDHKLGEKIHNNILYVNKIKLAIEHDRIVPYFQGIVDNQTQKIVKYEALIRLIDENGSVLSPYWFLEHAKKAKLYDILTRIMITKVFEIFEPLEYSVSINLTLQDIVCDETRIFLYDKLATSPLSSRIVFEIVESEGIENFGVVIEFIQRVKGFGGQIAIDDFGTGYSNFNYLSKLDIDYLKIDGSLIKHINTDPDLLLTVESILFYAHKKGIQVIAEFVEEEAIYHTLVKLGIQYSQGYLFSIPSATL